MDPTRDFKKYLLYSVVFHGMVFTLFLFFAESAGPRKVPETKITMVSLSPRLGSPRGEPHAPPGLPRAVPAKPEAALTPSKPKAPVKEGPKAPAKKAPQEKPGPKVKIAKPPREKTKTPPAVAPDEKEISEALAEIEEELEERERAAQVPSAGSPTGTLPPGATPGLGSPEGTLTARDPGYAAYQSQVRSRIIRNWVQTHAGEETQKLRARVVVQINAAGEVISKSLVKGSGNASFDNSVLRAVERASPFPPPPLVVREEALREGFIVDFRSRMVGTR